MTDNTMSKRKNNKATMIKEWQANQWQKERGQKINNGPQKTTQKSKVWATRTSLNQWVKSGALED